jgi:tRNA A37 N6-isopentenylltransferase MiaA
MKRAFFIIGPTETGKSQLAADVAHKIGAEIVSADALQTHPRLDLLTVYLWRISPGFVHTPRNRQPAY